MADGKDVFISYHRATMAETLRQIAAELSNRGISSWYDTESPKPGQFTETIEKEIKCCKVFLFIWDDGANNSTWCRDEVLSALEHAKHIFLFRVGPLKTENAELNFRLRSFQRFDGDNPPDQKRIQQLTETIADTLRGSRPTWKLVYEREEQLKQLEFRLEQEQVSAKDAIRDKERRITVLERKLKQAESQIQAFKNKLGQKQKQILHLQTLQEQVKLVADELAQELDWRELELHLRAEREAERYLQSRKVKKKRSLAIAFIILIFTFVLLYALLFQVKQSLFDLPLINSLFTAETVELPTDEGEIIRSQERQRTVSKSS